MACDDDEEEEEECLTLRARLLSVWTTGQGRAG